MSARQDEVEEACDAFLLDPGLGPMTYLTADGHIVLDYRTWGDEGVVIETSLDQAIRSLVVGAQKSGLIKLLSLVPMLVNGSMCPSCEGTRFTLDGAFICDVCDGRGEVDERLLERARACRVVHGRQSP